MEKGGGRGVWSAPQPPTPIETPAINILVEFFCVPPLRYTRQDLCIAGTAQGWVGQNEQHALDFDLGRFINEDFSSLESSGKLGIMYLILWDRA